MRLAGFTSDVKAVFTMNTSAAVLGLGYIMGLDYAAIIMAGSMVSFFVLVPVFAYLGHFIPGAISAGAEPLAGMPPDEIFRLYVRPIGIGGIFAAGVLSILKMSGVIVEAVRQALGEVSRLLRGGRLQEDVRTDRGLPMSRILLAAVATGLGVLAYFRFSVLAGEPNAGTLALVATGLTLLIAFLFASVSAWAIAMISITPISGMTLTTLIVTAVALSGLGLRGESGMLQTLMIGGVVCTALSMSGSLVTQYKIGYWLGATPRRIEIWNMLGAVAASLATTAVILLMAHVYGFAPGPTHPHPLPAPQPNAMAAVLRGVMGESGAPWFLYGVGGVFAVSSEMCGVSGLAFALGMYLPMELNSPLVLGAAIAWLLQRSSKDKPLAAARHEKGTLIASGFIAGRRARRRAGRAAALPRGRVAREPRARSHPRRLHGHGSVALGLGQLARPRRVPRPGRVGLLGRAQGAGPLGSRRGTAGRRVLAEAQQVRHLADDHRLGLRRVAGEPKPSRRRESRTTRPSSPSAERPGAKGRWLSSGRSVRVASRCCSRSTPRTSLPRCLRRRGCTFIEPGTDPAVEVLKTEATLIDNGLQPSVFFRFPGLVSDAGLVSRVTSYGLIPVGSDAWLAKGQTPSSGSIVLVHGNGNEPIGIERFLELVRSERTAIREKHWLLFDLRESVSREEERR